MLGVVLDVAPVDHALAPPVAKVERAVFAVALAVLLKVALQGLRHLGIVALDDFPLRVRDSEIAEDLRIGIPGGRARGHDGAVVLRAAPSSPIHTSCA